MATEVVSKVPAAHGETRSERGLVDRLRSRSPWWLLPLTVVTALTLFSAYVVLVAIRWRDIPDAPGHPYYSPFFSPQPVFDFFHGRTLVPGAFFVLWSPLLFRATCYYYRKSYYRSFFWDPPACAVGELRKKPYHGEQRFPLLLNNLHRYFLYFAVIVVGFLWFDAVQAFSLGGRFYLGVGSVLMLANVVLLSGYTFGCHSFRHLVGGGMDCFSCARLGNARHSSWRLVSVLNGRHATWAWISMFSVAAVDIYIRMLNAGWFADPHLGG